MNNLNIASIGSGLLEAGVAFYAMRLTRLYGSKRVGWSLFVAFALLALLHISQFMGPWLNLAGGGEQIIYAVISALILVGMAHLESTLKQFDHAEGAEERANAEMEARVKQQTSQLMRANEELEEKAATLRTEVAHRRQMQDQMEQTHRELLAASRQAGMSEVATGVLHNVGNVLNSVNVSAALVADHLTALNVENLARAASMMREHAGDIGHFLTNDHKGKRLPDYLSQLASHLWDERTLLLKEIGFVRSKIEHIKEIVAAQQNYGKALGVAEKVRVEELVEDVLRIHASELLQHGVQIQRDYATGLPEVITDKHKALQILLNLITNAKHACVESRQESKRVTVRITNGEERIRVAMTDNGVGIPTENLKKIFNHGFTTRKNGGHGFGLHSGALTAKEMGGSLLAHSDGPGTGATFTLEIPLKVVSNPSKS
ncbi:MAG TPA: ATP-binding protein [Verrucomicrobiae bacterium]|jgi:C4-dicarboxylate-specific signal transduction histidine kinase|nr:ATP-binding protein [Verrucomicrobiae bacterium]